MFGVVQTKNKVRAGQIQSFRLSYLANCFYFVVFKKDTPCWILALRLDRQAKRRRELVVRKI